MKNLFTTTLAALFVLFPLTALPAGEHDTHSAHQNGATQSSADSGWVDGVIKKVDKSAGKVTVTHGPLTNLNMPAMTMAFRVKDAIWLDRLQMGGKIRFVAESVNGTLTIVRLEP